MRQAALFSDIPVEDEKPKFGAGWRDRIALMSDVSQRVGGLVPQTSVAECLGISETRVVQLCNTGGLEQVKLFGVTFVSGRSIEAWEDGERHRGGRGKRRVGLWQKMVYSVRLGNAIADVAVPD